MRGFGYGGLQEFSSDPYGQPGYELLGTFRADKPAPDGLPSFEPNNVPGTGYFAPWAQGYAQGQATKNALTNQFGAAGTISPIMLLAGIVVLVAMVKK